MCAGRGPLYVMSVCGDQPGAAGNGAPLQKEINHMSKHKRSATRKIVAASTIGALAASGAAFGVISSANADAADTSSAMTSTSPISINAAFTGPSIRGQLLMQWGSYWGVLTDRFSASVDPVYERVSGPTDPAIAQKSVYTYPAPGSTGPVINAAGQCLETKISVLRDNIPVPVYSATSKWTSCESTTPRGSAKQFRINADGRGIFGVG